MKSRAVILVLLHYPGGWVAGTAGWKDPSAASAGTG